MFECYKLPNKHVFETPTESMRHLMKPAKLLLSFILTLMVVISLSACGGSDSTGGNVGGRKTTGSLTGSGK